MTEEFKALNFILKVIEDFNRFNDVQTLLDKLLYEARRFSNADAGTIFLIQDNELHFSYLQNDTLFTSHADNKHQYVSQTIPINCDSIVGYVAYTGEMLVIEDVYELNNQCPYCFNASFDQQTGYRTKSMLVLPLPLGISKDKIVGVMQLINAKNDKGEVALFSEETQKYMPLFAFPAAEIIERCQMTREFILRMISMTQLHDPFETGQHVYRVGNFAAEIYHKWALNHDLDPDQIQRNKDSLRLAAMLHDVGKVSISDLILKKPAKLTDEEFEIMKQHTVYGARLFADSKTELEIMTYNVTLNHHEKWNGQGYPGHIDNIFAEGAISFGPGKKDFEIPLEGRITAIADVYDALSSKRCYKQAWPEDKILDLLDQESGVSFDPELIDIFFDIQEIILAIKGKYQDRPGNEPNGTTLCR